MCDVIEGKFNVLGMRALAEPTFSRTTSLSCPMLSSPCAAIIPDTASYISRILRSHSLHYGCILDAQLVFGFDGTRSNGVYEAVLRCPA